MLEVKNLSVRIGGKEIVCDISTTFVKGKVYAIMGPNGCGKSTLVGSIMGNPLYEVGEGSQIVFDGQHIEDLSPDKRARLGMYLSFQSPLTLSGVSVFQLLRYALDGKLDPLVLKNKVEEVAEQLKIDKELLGRSLNDGFSGGERKKMEVLQAAILQPQLAFFDEIDTGVDVDALKTIAEYLNGMRGGDKTFVVITHYNRILKYLKPDATIVIKAGEIAHIGGPEVPELIEEKGYEAIA